MLKDAKLGTRMGLGFGTLVVIAAALGVIGWLGVNEINKTVAMDQKGSECLESLNRCATLRRDFAARGFAKVEGQAQNAAEQWQAAFEELVNRLRGTQAVEGLNPEDHKLLQAAIAKSEDYKAAFDNLAEARKTKDAAFEIWRKTGWSVTEEVNKAVTTIIEPAAKAAQESEQLDEVIRWAQVADRLHKEVFEPFLLLRVCGVYLMTTQADEQWTAFQEQYKKVQAGLSAWTELVKGDPQLEKVAADIAGHFTQYEAAGKQYYQGITAGRQAETQLASVAADIVKTIHELQAGMRTELETISARTSLLLTIAGICVVIVGTLLAVLITRSIVKPINRIIANLNEGADQVTDAAGQVSGASQLLAEGASEQASSLEETSSALEEMSAMTRTNAENARQARDLTTEAKAAAENGDQTMHALNNAMGAINESSNEISKIIKVIEEIAFQTNLLALNAAVEAARAGEHGKGFAVVADEVRNLAQRAAKASREITGLIENSVTKVREGTNVAGEVGKVLTAIVTNVTQVANLVSGITKASEEQAQGVDQISTAVNQMDKVTQQNAAGAEESASAAEQLSAQAETVKGMVAELVALVGGRYNSAATTGRRPPTTTAKTGPGRANQRPIGSSKKKLAPPKTTAAPAEPVAAATEPSFDKDTANLSEF